MTDHGRTATVSAAAASNAALCDAVCRGHGLATHADAGLWWCARRTPAGYPDAVTLAGDVGADVVVDAIDDGPGASIKDSFAILDLADRPGWAVLFEAVWIARRGPEPPTGDPSIVWESVGEEAELAEWASAWDRAEPDGSAVGAALFVPELLAQDLLVVAGRRGGRVVAGAILDAGSAVVGISNVFAVPDEPEVDPWAGALALAADRFPDAMVVGYESGDDLEAAFAHGFEPLGPLRIWMRAG